MTLTSTPRLNPGCADIGVHPARVYCEGDPGALAAAVAREEAAEAAPGAAAAPPPLPPPRPTNGVPADCSSWDDGCNRCGAKDGVLK